MVHPMGTVDICTKFNGNPFNSYLDISLKTTKINLMVVLEGKVEGSCRWYSMNVYKQCPRNFCSIWTKMVDQPTNIGNPGVILLA